MSMQAIIVIYSSLYSAYLIKVDVYVMFYIVVSNLSILIKHKVRSRQGGVCIPFFCCIYFFSQLICLMKSLYLLVEKHTYQYLSLASLILVACHIYIALVVLVQYN